MVAATSSFVSCKDYEGDNYAEFKEKYASLQAAYEAQVSGMQDFVQRYNDETGYSAAELAQSGTIKERLDELEDSSASYDERIQKNNIAIAKAQGLAERDSAYLRSLLAGWDTGGTLGDMVSEAAGLLTALKSDTAKYNFAYDTVSTYYKEWNEAVEIADKAWAFVNNGQVTGRGQKFETLQDMANAYDNAVDSLQAEIDALNQDVKNILATINSQVTGIEIQATVNPIFGSFAYPIGVQSNILATRYGKSDLAYKFPNVSEDYWVGNQSFMSQAEFELMNPEQYTVKKGYLFADSVGNAGTLYVTVNPSDLNHEGKSFTLRSSDNQVSKVTLSDLENASNDRLIWGWRRASSTGGSVNGFYKAKATIAEADLEDSRFSFQLASMDYALQNLFDNWYRPGSLDIGAMWNLINNGIKMSETPRYAVQAEWKDTLGWKNYVSKYELAAVSYKPLGYGAFADGDFTNYSKYIQKIQDYYWGKITTFRTELLNSINFQLADGTQFKDIQDKLNKYDVEYVAPNTILIKESESGKIVFEITVKNSEDFGSDLQEGYGNLVYVVNNLQSRIDAKTSEIRNIFDDMAYKLGTKLDTYFSNVKLILDNPTRLLMPALFATTDASTFVHVSRAFDAPTTVTTNGKGGNVAFFPSSVTNEMLAPAFKKFIGVSNVIKGYSFDSGMKSAVAGDADCKEKLKALNNSTDFCKVVDGDKYNANKNMMLQIPAGMSDYTIEVAYYALGYDGKTAGKKFYIYVK